MGNFGSAHLLCNRNLRVYPFRCVGINHGRGGFSALLTPRTRDTQDGGTPDTQDGKKVGLAIPATVIHPRRRAGATGGLVIRLLGEAGVLGDAG